MNQFIRMLMIEWKLLFRGVFAWIVCLSLVGIFYLAALDDYRTNELGWQITNLLLPYLSLLLLIAQFVTVAVARRDITTRIDPLLNAIPYSSWQVIGARLLAVIIPFTCLTMLPALYYIVVGLLRAMAWHELSTGVLVMCTYIIPLILTIVVAYGIGSSTKRRISYLISLVVFVFVILVARSLFSQFMPVHWTHLVDIPLADLYNGKFYSGLWGFVTDRSFWLHRLLYGSITVILLAMLIWRAMMRRRESFNRLAISTFVGCAAIIGIVSVSSYASIWAERTAVFAERIAFYEQELVRENPLSIQRQVIDRFWANGGSIQPADSFDGMNTEDILANASMGNPLTLSHQQDLLLGQQYESLTVSSYELDVSAGEDHWLTVNATLHLSHDLDDPMMRFPLSLRHIFAVDAVHVNGVEADFKRETHKDVLWIEPSQPLIAEDDFSLSMSYSGQVDEWYLRQSYRPKEDYWERRAFVDDDRLFLPAYFGWYPQPGNGRLAEYEKSYYGYNHSSRISHEIRENMNAHVHADFHVQVHAGHKMTLAANGSLDTYDVADGMQQATFTAKGSDGFHLIGGNIYTHTATQGGKHLTIIYSDQVASEARAAITENVVAHMAIFDQLLNTLQPDLRLPAELVFVRADNRAATDHWSVEQSTEDALRSKTNTLMYLPYLTHTARLDATPTGANQDMQRLFLELLNQSLFSLVDLSHQYEALVADMIIGYIDLEVHPKEVALLDRHHYKLSSGYYWGEALTMINSLYEDRGHTAFPAVIRDIYDYLSQTERLADDHLEAFIAFLRTL